MGTMGRAKQLFRPVLCAIEVRPVLLQQSMLCAAEKGPSATCPSRDVPLALCAAEEAVNLRRLPASLLNL